MSADAAASTSAPKRSACLSAWKPSSEDEALVRARGREGLRDGVRSHGGEGCQLAVAGYALRMPETVEVPPVGAERLSEVLGEEQLQAFGAGTEDALALLDGRTVWNVNSTARGGGVVELLRPLVGYARGIGIDCRWEVIGGDPGFFDVTKRLHNRLHGAEGDGRPLDDDARRTYEGALHAEADALAARIRPEDVVILHDPQTAGLVEPLRRTGAKVVWRCHIGLDEPNDIVRDAWAFLRPYVESADAFVFSRAAFAWEQPRLRPDPPDRTVDRRLRAEEPGARRGDRPRRPAHERDPARRRAAGRCRVRAPRRQPGTGHAPGRDPRGRAPRRRATRSCCRSRAGTR